MSNRLMAYAAAVFAVALSAPFSHAVLTGDITGPSQSAGFPSGLSDGVGEARVRFSRALVGNQAGQDLFLAQTAGTAGQTAADFSTPLPVSTEQLLVELLYDGGSNFTLRTTGSQLAPGPISEITRDFSTVENVGDFALRSFQFRTKADTGNNFEMIVSNPELRNSMGDVLPLPGYDTDAGASERFSFVDVRNIAGAEDGFTFSAAVQPLNVGGVTSTGEENLNFEVLFGGEVVPAMNGNGGGPSRPGVLVVTNNNSTSQPLVDFLEGRGHEVTRGAFADAAPTADFLADNNIGLVFVARESNSGDYNQGTEPQDWNALEVPMINANMFLYRDSRWGWQDGGSLPGQGSLSDWDPFLDPDNPIFDGATLSLFDMATGVTGVGNPLVPEAEILATLNNGGTPAIFVIPEGTTMFNDRGVAGAERWGFIYGNEGAFANLSDNGRLVLGQLIDSLSAGVPEPSSALLLILAAAGMTKRRRRAA